MYRPWLVASLIVGCCTACNRDVADDSGAANDASGADTPDERAADAGHAGKPVDPDTPDTAGVWALALDVQPQCREQQLNERWTEQLRIVLVEHDGEVDVEVAGAFEREGLQVDGTLELGPVASQALSTARAFQPEFERFTLTWAHGGWQVDASGRYKRVYQGDILTRCDFTARGTAVRDHEPPAAAFTLPAHHLDPVRVTFDEPIAEAKLLRIIASRKVVVDTGLMVSDGQQGATLTPMPAWPVEVELHAELEVTDLAGNTAYRTSDPFWLDFPVGAAPSDFEASDEEPDGWASCHRAQSVSHWSMMDFATVPRSGESMLACELRCEQATRSLWGPTDASTLSFSLAVVAQSPTWTAVRIAVHSSTGIRPVEIPPSSIPAPPAASSSGFAPVQIALSEPERNNGFWLSVTNAQSCALDGVFDPAATLLIDDVRLEP